MTCQLSLTVAVSGNKAATSFLFSDPIARLRLKQDQQTLHIRESTEVLPSHLQHQQQITVYLCCCCCFCCCPDLQGACPEDHIDASTLAAGYKWVPESLRITEANEPLLSLTCHNAAYWDKHNAQALRQVS